MKVKAKNIYGRVIEIKDNVAKVEELSNDITYIDISLRNDIRVGESYHFEVVCELYKCVKVNGYEEEFKEGCFELKVVDYLISQIKRFGPFKMPNRQKWAKHIYYMQKIDNIHKRDILQVLDFATNDPFWQSNILSTHKFRIQYKKLYIQMLNYRNVSKSNSFKSLSKELEDFINGG